MIGKKWLLLTAILLIASIAFSQSSNRVIQSFSVDSTAVGTMRPISATLFNPSNQPQAYHVTAIAQLGETEYYRSETSTPWIEAQQTKTISFPLDWKPTISGTYAFTIIVSSADNTTKIDSNAIQVEVTGTRDYAVFVSCNPTEVFAGEEVDYNIFVYNNGTFLEKLGATTTTISQSNQKIDEESFTFSVKPGEFYSMQETEPIPSSVDPGTYSAKVSIASPTNISASCAFQVKQTKEYYQSIATKTLDQFQKLENSILQKKRGGFDTSSIEGQALPLKQIIQHWSDQINNGKTAGSKESLESINQQIDAAEKKLNSLSTTTENPNILGSINDILLLGFIAISCLAVIALLWRGFFDKIMGIGGEIKL